jgi:hypothetical protein
MAVAPGFAPTRLQLRGQRRTWGFPRTGFPFHPGLRRGTFSDAPLLGRRAGARKPQTNLPGTVGWLELKPPSTAIAWPLM